MRRDNMGGSDINKQKRKFILRMLAAIVALTVIMNLLSKLIRVLIGG